jgi:amino acid adenylation domain-containing protein
MNIDAKIASSLTLLDVLPHATHNQTLAWASIDTAVTGDENRALATWLLAIDHVKGMSVVGIAMKTGWLQLPIDRDLPIAAWIDLVRTTVAGALATVPNDAEMAWGTATNDDNSILMRLDRGGDGCFKIHYRTPPLSSDGVRTLAALWVVASCTDHAASIGDIAWHEATATSVARDDHWRRKEPLDVPSNFDRTLERCPNDIAIVEGDRHWTYGEVDARANAVAQVLLARGTRPGEIVGIALPRGVSAIATMLGILRVSAAYLPLDPEYPAERLRFMIEDAAVRLLFSDDTGRARFSGLAVELLDVPTVGQSRPALLPTLRGDTLAYVMYTSGSTGQPKGVEVLHQGIARLVLDCAFMPLADETVMLHAAPLGFDASTLEIWGPLLNGGRCVVHNEATPTGSGLAQTIAASGAHAAWLTAALFNAVIEDDPLHLAALKTLLIGGEALSVSHVRRFLIAAPRTRLINGYGPTETTTFAATHPITLAMLENAHSVPIGLPINATSLYVLNQRGEPVPRGLIGELYIGGLGVARGYRCRPELTAERFLADPFAANGTRMYRTGDQVRMLAGGEVDFVGRIDGQVKIRGFRIETTEVEFALSQCSDVSNCAVVVQRDPVRGAELVAYVVSSSSNFSATALKQQLGSQLPDYMMPTHWLRMDVLPVTANGKLDRKALPLPNRQRPEDLAYDYVEPKTGPERDVAQAFVRTLGIDRVGALDNFFDLGGNSLLVLRAHAAIRDAGHGAFLIAHFFADPTPRAIARGLGAKLHGASTLAATPNVVRSGGDAEPIAVIGMAGRFPGAPDIEAFWRVLSEGRETIRFFAPDELDASIPTELRQDDRYVPARGVIDGVDLFDAGFFGISPREAELMDPQQRVFLELAWECLERAGQVPEKTPTPIGIFAGMYNASYFQKHVLAHPDKVARVGDFQVMLANEKDYIATRTAHKLNLTGPAVSVHTACSTSLVAIAQAFDSLRAGQCGLALAGGVSITCPPASGYLYQEGAMLSPDGHTRTFDVAAQGTVFSDGAAVVLLRRLSDAIADGNTIWAVIRGVAVNNDGAAKASFTAPSLDGQATVVRAALAHAGVDARSIDYVEAHGTATPLGDPVEVAALTEAFRAQTNAVGFCALGSVKSNVGHMVIAAGAAGVIKTALSLHHEALPATLHFTNPNPKIDFAGSPFVVNDQHRPWPRSNRPRLAGVSSFGVGGTNAHAILQEAPPPLAAQPGEGLQLLRLSARTTTALKTMVGNLATHLEGHPALDLADVAFTLDAGRRDFSHRSCIVAENVAEAIGLLRGSSGGRAGAQPAAEPLPVMMFPGQGAQYPGMGRELHARNPEFRRALEACFDALVGHVPFDLRARMFAIDAAALSQTEVTQPAIFALEYALARAWLAQSVTPTALVGHSVGEFVAATLAGVMRVEDAIRLVAKRGSIMQALPTGAMLSVRLAASAVEPLLPTAIQLAAENGPTSCVVAGPSNAIDAFAALLEAQGCAARRLQTSHAFHSAMMEPAVPEFQAAVKAASLAAPRIPIASTVTGQWLSAAEATDPAYWARHMTQPVRFSAAVRKLQADLTAPLFLEVGPRATLCSLVRQHQKPNAVPLVVASLGDDPSRELRLLTEAAGQLWVAGCATALSASPAEGRRRIVLPTYPFERQRHWVEAKLPTVRLVAGHHKPSAATTTTEPIEFPPPVLLVTNAMNAIATTDRRPQLLQRLHVLFEDISGVEVSTSDADLSFVELGLDSLMLTQVALQLKKEFALPITFRQLMESLCTFRTLAGYLDDQLPAEPTQPVAPAAQSPLSLQQALVRQPTATMQQSSTVDMPLLHQVIQQQMALMSQHLALLQGDPAAAPVTSFAVSATPKPVPSPALTPTASAPIATLVADNEAALAHTTYDVKKAFGALPRIHTAGTELTERQRARLDAFIRRYVEKTQRSKAYTVEHRAHHADPRVVNGFRPQFKEIIYQIVIERSKAARLWDLDGNSYVDALNGFGMSLFGWQPEFVVDAVRRQLDSGYDIGPQHPLAGEVAKLICELTGFDRAGLCNTGSEAVMGCIRIARTVTGRSKIAIFSGAYHGIFDEVIVRGTRKGKAVPAAPGIMRNTAENVVVLDYGTPETLEWLKNNAADLAAVLVEPVQSRRPDFQPQEFLRELRTLTAAQGTLLIFDEVVTGFRSHPGGVQALFDIRADLASYGKVVGGGFPIGVIAGKRDYMDALDGGHWTYGDNSIPTVGVTYFAGTFVRHPLALVAAKAVLEHIKHEGAELQAALTRRTIEMVQDLNTYCVEVGAPITVKSFSSIWKVIFEEDHPLQDLLFAMMRNRGVHILDNFPCFMTTAHKAEDIAVIKTAFKEAVAELQESDFLPKRISAKVLALDASRPPVPGARLGRDAEGKPAWFVANPEQPGKYIKVDSK